VLHCADEDIPSREFMNLGRRQGFRSRAKSARCHPGLGPAPSPDEKLRAQFCIRNSLEFFANLKMLLHRRQSLVLESRLHLGAVNTSCRGAGLPTEEMNDMSVGTLSTGTRD
jgi:hypothetical protein